MMSLPLQMESTIIDQLADKKLSGKPSSISVIKEILPSVPGRERPFDVLRKTFVFERRVARAGQPPFFVAAVFLKRSLETFLRILHDKDAF